MNRATVLLAVLFALFAVNGHVFADGKVFATEATAEVDIPDQEALIHWSDGVETLVIRTSFTGEGDEFAWVVPTPTEPEVTASTTGLFPTLRTLTAPKVRMKQQAWCVPVLVVVVVLCCFRLRAWVALACFVFLGLLVLILLPSLGSARAMKGYEAVAGVEVLQEATIGDYDVAVLSADESESLVSWLNGNGYHVPDTIEPVAKAYIDDDWYFTAVRLRRDAVDKEESSTHPLAFRFEADQPVYPMRLTAVDSDGLSVDLYVFGPERAKADGFEVAYCNQTAFPPLPELNEWARGWQGDQVPVWHPELASRVEKAPFVSKLSARLAPTQMQRDILIGWDGDHVYVPRPYSRSAAKRLGTNVGLTGLGFSVLLAVFLVPKARTGHDSLANHLGVGVTRGFIFWIVVASLIPYVVPVAEELKRSYPTIYWLRHQNDLQQLVWSFSAIDNPTPEDIEKLEENIQTSTSWISYDDMKIGDAEGELTYEWTDGGLVIIAYGPDGAPLRIDNNEPDRD